MAQATHVTTAIPAPITGGTPKSLSVRAAYAALASALGVSPPRPIPLKTRPIDLEDRAEHLAKVLGPGAGYLREILDDTAANVSGGLELKYIEGALSDLQTDIVGTVPQAAENIAGRFA